MSKNRKIDLRVSAEELLQIDRLATALRMSRSDYLRAAATSGIVAHPGPTPAAPTAADTARLDAIDERLADIDAALRASASAFETLLQKLGDVVRVPTFTEYRARLHAEGVDRRADETDEQYLLRCARRYHVAYGVWPDPHDTRAFGRVPAGYDAAKFPPSPPSG